jgi:HD-like signal output (HDOD) protein
LEANDHLERMRRIAQRVNNIPTLPIVMARVIELVDNPNTTAAQLAEFISRDQALTIKILKLANSAFYGFPQKIGTINLAIVVLGFESVKDLGLSAAVIETFQNGQYGDNFDLNKFWEHSVAVAAGCKILSRGANINIAGEIFVAGLLHDIGKLVLLRFLTEEFNQAVETARQKQMELYKAELESLGFSHADVGGWLAERWNLPFHQSNAIYYHPYPWLSFREPNLAMVVNFANILAHRAGYCSDLEGSQPDAHPKMLTYLKIKGTESQDVDWDFYLKALGEEMQRASGFLSLLKRSV